ncbi:MAG: glycosyltransferase family 2 protein [Caulobacterales bacterium]
MQHHDDSHHWQPTGSAMIGVPDAASSGRNDVAAAPRLAMSVVICTHNRPDDIGACLSSLLAQRNPAMEIIVVDSASQPAARQHLLDLAAPHPDIRVALVNIPGVVHARNHGLGCARGEWIALLDDDATPDPDWGAEALALLKRLPKDVGVVGAYTYPLWPASPPPGLPRLWLKMLSLIDDEFEGDCIEASRFVGANMFLRRKPLVENGGFSPMFGRVGDMLLSGDDVFPAELLARQGWRTWYSNRPRAGHRIPAARLEPSWFRRRMYWEGVTRRRLDFVSGGVLSPVAIVQSLLSIPALALLSLGEGRYGTRLARAYWHLGVLRAMWRRT